jgi:hypothetical protein
VLFLAVLSAQPRLLTQYKLTVFGDTDVMTKPSDVLDVVVWYITEQFCSYTCNIVFISHPYTNWTVSQESRIGKNLRQDKAFFSSATDYMEQNPLWEADSRTDGRGIPHVLWNLKIHCRVYKNPLFVRVLRHMNSASYTISLICFFFNLGHTIINT